MQTENVKNNLGRERNAYSGATGVALNSGSGFNSTTNKIITSTDLKNRQEIQ